MKRAIDLLSVFLLAAFYNLLGHGHFRFDRVRKPGFWLMTVVMTIVLMLCIVTISSLRNYLEKYWRKRLASEEVAVREQRIKPGSGLLIVYYLLAVLPLTTLFMIVVSFSILGRPQDEYLLWNNLFYRAPVLMAILFICAHVVLRRRPFAQRPAYESTAIGGYVDLYNLFPYLYKLAGVDPLWDTDKRVRLFDVVFIQCRSKEYHVILSDGSKHRCNRIIGRLKEAQLDHFFVKLSAGYKVNMLLVSYPVAQPHLRVALQPEVFRNMQKLFPKAALNLMLNSGGRLKGKYVMEFLDGKNSFDYKGWDDFVSLS